MGHAHGEKWTEQDIINGIKEVMEKLELDTCPTHEQIEKYYNNSALSNRITRTGGIVYWANKLGLKQRESESKSGRTWELECLLYLQELGYNVDRMATRHPYDLLVNKSIKVDVKMSYLYDNNGNSPFYTFNLEKSCPTCDIYVCYCLNKEKKVEKTYVIPSIFLTDKTQLSLGVKTSVYDRFIDKWSYFNAYDNFYKSIK